MIIAVELNELSASDLAGHIAGLPQYARRRSGGAAPA